MERNTKSTASSKQHENTFKKPSATTLLRIRYYEFKIRMEDCCESFRERLSKNMFCKLISVKRSGGGSREIQRSAEIPENYENNNEVVDTKTPHAKRVRRRGQSNNAKISDADDEESELEPGEVPASPKTSLRKVKSGGRTSRGRNRYNPASVVGTGKKKQRKRRSSLTRTKSSDVDQVAEHQTKKGAGSGASGDVNFGNSENKSQLAPDQLPAKQVRLESKKQKRKRKKEEKQTKRLLKKEKKNKNKPVRSPHIETNSGDPNGDLGGEAKPTPTTDADAAASHQDEEDDNLLLDHPPESEFVNSKASSLIGGVWEWFSKLANRKRPRPPEGFSPTPFAFGLHVHSTTGYIRRKNFKSQRESALMDAVGENINNIGNYVSKFSRTISEGANPNPNGLYHHRFQPTTGGVKLPVPFSRNMNNLPEHNQTVLNLNSTVNKITSNSGFLSSAHETLSKYFSANTNDRVRHVRESPSVTREIDLTSYVPRTHFTSQYSNLLKPQNF